nr:hypothetical protein [uncultured Roseateles sp.]
MRVQPGHQLAGAVAGRVALEHPAHDGRFVLIDHHVVAAFIGGGFGAVAIAAAAGAHAPVELASQAAVRFLAQIVQVHLVDQAARDAHDLAAAGF